MKQSFQTALVDEKQNNMKCLSYQNKGGSTRTNRNKDLVIWISDMVVLAAAPTLLTGLGASHPITAQTDSGSVIKQPWLISGPYKEKRNETVEGESQHALRGQLGEGKQMREQKEEITPRQIRWHKCINIADIVKWYLMSTFRWASRLVPACLIKCCVTIVHNKKILYRTGLMDVLAVVLCSFSRLQKTHKTNNNNEGKNKSLFSIANKYRIKNVANAWWFMHSLWNQTNQVNFIYVF